MPCLFNSFMLWLITYIFLEFRTTYSYFSLRLLNRVKVVSKRVRTSTLYCFTLLSSTSDSGRKWIEVAGIRVFTESQYHSVKSFFKRISIIGIDALQTKLDDLARHLGDDLFRALSDSGYGVKFLTNDIDLIDDMGEIIFRGNKDDLKAFFSHFNKPRSVRSDTMSRVNSRLSRGSACYNSTRAAGKGVNVPRSRPPAGQSSPDFLSSPFLYSGSLTNTPITTIRLTGSRSLDFKAAFRAIGITDPKKIKVILKNHTWHHLDDLDPHTLECTMQLITKTGHRATYPHYGSCKQLVELLGLSEYR